MSNSNTAAQTIKEEGKCPRPKRTSISFKRKKASYSTAAAAGNSAHEARAGESSKRMNTFLNVLKRGARRPINQRFRELDEQGGFARSDPERPNKKHRDEARDGVGIEEEIEALRELIMVNTCSIARRTPYPESLLWPLVATLARVIEEYLDETSEYEMSELNFALTHLEAASGGKLRFARKSRRRQMLAE